MRRFHSTPLHSISLPFRIVSFHFVAFLSVSASLPSSTPHPPNTYLDHPVNLFYPPKYATPEKKSLRTNTQVSPARPRSRPPRPLPPARRQNLLYLTTVFYCTFFYYCTTVVYCCNTTHLAARPTWSFETIFLTPLPVPWSSTTPPPSGVNAHQSRRRSSWTKKASQG